MRSARAKVLHELLGRPLVAYPVGLARELGASPVVAVLGHQRELVEGALAARFGAGAITAVEQAEQRGTGHAVRLAMPALAGFDGILVVLYGDVPLLRRETLQELVGIAGRYHCLAIVTATPADATGYGRVVRDSRGHVTGVVEEKDATSEERAITEVNAGIYAAPAGFLRTATADLVAKNAQGEYYLTDIIATAARSIGVTGVEADARDVAGINDREQLAEAEATMRARINRHWQAHATLREPATIVVEPDVTIDVDAEIGRNVTLRGRTRVGHGARIEDGSILADTEVGAGAHVLPYTISNEAVIGAGADHRALRAPAARHAGRPRGARRQLRRAQEDRARPGQQGQPPHVPRRRHHRREGQRRRRHDHLQLQRLREAPDDHRGRRLHRLGQPARRARARRRRAVVAAGTTVTRDVPAGALAIARPEQHTKPGYADAVAERYARPGLAKPVAAKPMAKKPVAKKSPKKKS